MNTRTHITTVMTYAAAAVFGCAAAVAVASTAAVSQVSPSLRTSPRAATEVIRLEPVVVTISRSGFDAVRSEVELARASAAAKVTRG